MILRWLRKRRRRAILSQPFPDAWEKILHANVHHYRMLDEAQQSKLKDDLKILVAEKNWEGCGGQVMNDEVKVTIAAHVAVLTLGFQQQYFDHVLSILVYPDAYVAPEQSIKGGIVVQGKSAREGEAWYRGPVILSWDDVLANGQGRNGGHNLVLHEFAHQLDMLNGRSADGVPSMDTKEQADRWVAVLDFEFDKLCRDCLRRRPTVLDCYGTTNKAEFFAVATEAFFERPRELKRYHHELFDNLQKYYCQVPVEG